MIPRTAAVPEARGARALLLALLVLVALSGLANFSGLGRRLLWNPVEPRYAGVVAEMLDGNGRLVPLDAEQPYDQKAPLAFWMAWLGIEISGERDLFWLRLPSALGVLGMAMATLLLGRRWFGLRTGLLAACMLVTAWLPFWSGRFFHLDTLFGAQTAFLVLALEGAAREKGRRRLAWIAGGGLAFGVALLTKGPLPLAVATAVLALAALARRDAEVLRRSGLVPVIAIGLAIAACWFLPAWRAAGDAWARELVIGQGIGRIARGNAFDKHGPLYYPLAFLGMAGPWSLLVPIALWSGLDRRRTGGVGADRDGLIVSWCWFGLVFLVLTFFVQRRSRYLMPLLPPTTLLVANLVDRELWNPATRRRRTVIAAAVVMAALFVAGLALALGTLFPAATARALGPGSWSLTFDELAGSRGAAALAAAGALVAVAGLVALMRRRWLLAPPAAILLLAVCWSGWGWFGAPAIDRALRGDEALFAAIRPHLEQGRGLGVVGYRAFRESEFGFFRWNLGVAIRRFPCRGETATLPRDEPLLLLVAAGDAGPCAPLLGTGWRLADPRPLGSQGYRLWIAEDPER